MEEKTNKIGTSNIAIEPKNNHGVNFDLQVNSEDANVIREALISAGHIKLADNFELKRELSIMHEVKSCDGNNIFEKIGNCLESWRKDNYYDSIRQPRYKRKHRQVYGSNA